MIKDNLQRLQEFIQELRGTNSSNGKKEIFEKWKSDEFITKVLFYTYNPYYKYNVTSKNIEKYRGGGKTIQIETIYDDLFPLLEDLRDRNISGHTALQAVLLFIEFVGEENKELIYLILDKDLKTRLSIGLINKVIPKFIPQFEVALALKEEEGNPDFEKETWLSSRKLDGVRCILLVDKEGNVKTLSREGNEFHTLSILKEQIKRENIKNVVSDGEICLIDKDGKESFQGLMKEIGKGDHTIKNPRFLVFDILPYDDFHQAESPQLLLDRQKRLNVFLSVNTKLKNFKQVEQTIIRSKSHFEELRAESIEKGWEGLIIRKNVPYQGKRSKDMLKVKLMHDAEFVVQGIKSEEIRFFEPGEEIKVEKREVMLSKAIIHYKGFEVGVGSGWTIAERRKYHANPELLIGKEITVQYFEQTANQEGGESLRFPTKKQVWENGKRDI